MEQVRLNQCDRLLHAMSADIARCDFQRCATDVHRIDLRPRANNEQWQSQCSRCRYTCRARDERFPECTQGLKLFANEFSKQAISVPALPGRFRTQGRRTRPCRSSMPTALFPVMRACNSLTDALFLGSRAVPVPSRGSFRRCGASMADSTSQAASSRALSVPCPKCTSRMYQCLADLFNPLCNIHCDRQKNKQP